MLKDKILLIAAIATILASTMLGFCGISLSNAILPNAGANPRIIYWPRTEVRRYNNWVNIDHGSINAKSIVWSPSGRYLLIHGEIMKSGGDPQSVNTLIMDVENGTLAYSLYLDLRGFTWERVVKIAFSPDETKIFYLTTVSYGEFLPQIYSVNLDGTNPTPLIRINSTRRPYLFDVTRNGFLVYSENLVTYDTYNPTSGYNYTSCLWKYNLNTGEKSLVLMLEGMDQLITGLSVSPEGNKIAYAVGSEVWVADVDGAEPPMKVTSAPSGKIVTFVDFTPNGTVLTYSAVNGTIDSGGFYMKWDESFAGNITAVNLDGSNERAILGNGYGLVWSPINGSIAAYIRFQLPDYWYGLPYIIDFTMPITPNPDSDGDGLSDVVEVKNFLCPIDPADADMDYDEDGLTNREEIEYRTYMGNRDNDGDGLSDGVEVKVFRTDPLNPDTDNDGYGDGVEAAATGLNALVNVLPAGWIRMQLEWRNKRMYVSTNSSVLGVVFNSTSMALTVNVGGPDGTAGVANITVPIDMISSLSTVTVTLDNQPLDFQISQAGGYAQIYVQYHHSFHQLTAHLSGGGGGIGGVNLTGILGYWWLILSIAIVAVASVIAAIIVKRG